MQPEIRRFLTYLVKPWDDLNALLAQPMAVQPDHSDVSGQAYSLAVAIKHQCDRDGPKQRRTINSLSVENELMSDIADTFKHGKVDDASRTSDMAVASQFEGNSANQFRFMRNVIIVSHASLGENDFMMASRSAIQFWIGRLGLPIGWSPQIAEARSAFADVMTLTFNPEYQVSMSETRFRVVRRSLDGEFEPYDPPSIRFAVY